MLADADVATASHVVMVSSAMVYGAFANNPVPITEESVLRPDPEFVFARQLAAAEELVEEWRRAGHGRSVTVLRPALAMAEDRDRARSAGFDGYLEKPISPRSLPAQVERFLAGGEP